MRNAALAATLLSASILSGCASETTLITIPARARVYVNDQYRGESPVDYSDRRTILSTSMARFELDGYQTRSVRFRRNDKINPLAAVGSIAVLVPLLWIRNYKESYQYELEPLAGLVGFGNAYREAAASIELGDGKEEVLGVLMPTQAGIDARGKRAPESHVRPDGVRVEIHYFRCNVQPDGRVDKDDYAPYVFNDDNLVSVGWEALDGSDAR